MTTSDEPQAEAIQATSVAEAVGGNVACTLRAFLAYFVKLGTFGFDDPIALAGYMQRDLVEERRWISKQDSRTPKEEPGPSVDLEAGILLRD